MQLADLVVWEAGAMVPFNALREPLRLDLVEARTIPTGTTSHVYRPHRVTRLPGEPTHVEDRARHVHVTRRLHRRTRRQRAPRARSQSRPECDPPNRGRR